MAEELPYVPSGRLEHRDSMGNGGIIGGGDVQMMCAGTGVRHSEGNPSAREAVHLLQIWVLPPRRDLPPACGQRHGLAAEVPLFDMAPPTPG
ncbi:MAG: pirin family protein [Acidithiobacillus sp.]|uniref:pirin family protein n=1 Tax=Acidithiobacillus sp. TaxID=1872118 RepID=UPI003CFD1406